MQNPLGILTVGIEPASAERVTGLSFELRPLKAAQNARSLRELLGDYAFFTTALAFTWGPFGFDTFTSFYAEYGDEPPIYCWEGARPLFYLPDEASEWRRVLLAIERPHWEALRDYLVSLVVADGSTRQITAIGLQTIAIPDPLSLLPQVIPVTSFGVNGSERAVALDPSDRRVIISPPLPEAVAYATALFRGDNPQQSFTDTRRRRHEMHPGDSSGAESEV